MTTSPTVRDTLALPTGTAHVASLQAALGQLLEQVAAIDLVAGRMAAVLDRGGRVLVAGNGGSAAQAQHLTSELVGRYRDERRPLSALCLHGDSSSVTAIVNDYGSEEMFARQVRAHGRPGDIFVGLSTSGRSANVVRAAEAAIDGGLRVVALTGGAPNALCAVADDVIAIDASSTATVQEVHQVVVHLLCAALDVALGVAAAAPDPVGPR